MFPKVRINLRQVIRQEEKSLNISIHDFHTARCCVRAGLRYCGAFFFFFWKNNQILWGVKIPTNNEQKVKTYCLNKCSQITAAWSKWCALFVVFIFQRTLMCSYWVILSFWQPSSILIELAAMQFPSGQFCGTVMTARFRELWRKVWTEPCRVDCKRRKWRAQIFSPHIFSPSAGFHTYT